MAYKHRDEDREDNGDFPGARECLYRRMEVKGMFHVRYGWKELTAACEGGLWEERRTHVMWRGARF